MRAITVDGGFWYKAADPAITPHPQDLQHKSFQT
jgi:hypothetical protein